MTAFAHSLDRSILIRAERRTVFAFSTDSARFASWWGAGSTIEGRPGGRMRIVYPNGATASGEVLEVVPEERIVFSYGYDDPGKPIPPGGSRVTITLEESSEGTLLHLRHELEDAKTRDEHVPGWRYQLALFAVAAARAQNAGLTAVVDGYFGAWNEPDAARREEALAAATSDGVEFRDAYGCTRGRDELAAHIEAVRRFMPGARLARRGDVRECQGTALVDWTVTAPDGTPRGSGTDVFLLGADGRITSAVGLRNA